MAPVLCARPRRSLILRGTGTVLVPMPRKARRTLPCATSTPSTKLAVLDATAKQIPCAPEMIAVLIPITSPCDETIAGIKRRVGLNDIVDQAPVFRPQRAPERRNDPCGHAGVEAEGIADRDGDLARLQGFRIAELCRGKLRVLIGPDQGEIGVGVVAEDAAGEAAPIKRHHLGMLGALHDMTSGQNKAVRR